MRIFRDIDSLPSFRQSVLTIGSFDGVHVGHRKILAQVSKLAHDCGGESVVITFDPHPRVLLFPAKDFELINTTDEKLALLEGCGIDNVVVVPFTPAFAAMSAEEYVEQFLIEKFRPKCIVIGYDHRFGAKREGDMAMMERYASQGHFEVEEIPKQQIDAISVSSSKIRKSLMEKNLAIANKLLSVPFKLHGIVVQGDRIGRSLGFPTANLSIPNAHKLIPPVGIYAARAKAQGQWYDAMLYIGNRPTIDQKNPGNRFRVEVNLIDFDADIYGTTLEVEVIEHIRDDMKLDGLPALQAQIQADKAAIMQVLHPPKLVLKTAIVILNYNTRKHLEEYMPSVIAHSHGAEIIVADNGSPDDSIAFLRDYYPNVRVLDLGKNHGFAQGYNEALRQVKADVYVILNSDVEVTAGWMQPILTAMQNDPTIAIAQPKIKAHRQRTHFEYAGASGGWIDFMGYPFCRGRIFSTSEEDKGQYDTPQACFWAAGAAFFIRAELYHLYGGFDGDYFAHNEEIDLCWRLKRAGYSVWCYPESVVYHLGGGTLEYENPRKVFLNFRNSLYTLIKNAPLSRLLWLIPARLLLDGLAGVRFLLKGQYGAIFAVLKAHFSFYGHLPKLLNKRKAIHQTIKQHWHKNEENMDGMYFKSIVWEYYGRQKKRFTGLWK